MTESKVIGVRMTLEDWQKVQELADQAQTTPSEVMRALVRATMTIWPVEVAVNKALLQKGLPNANWNLP